MISDVLADAVHEINGYLRRMPDVYREKEPLIRLVAGHMDALRKEMDAPPSDDAVAADVGADIVDDGRVVKQGLLQIALDDGVVAINIVEKGRVVRQLRMLPQGAMQLAVELVKVTTSLDPVELLQQRVLGLVAPDVGKLSSSNKNERDQ
jgi:hypothetical protein